MQALVELIERYHPGFAQAIVPADPDIVEQLSELAGPLPGAYRRFLETMGESTADFKPLTATFDAEDRLLNYQLNDSLRGSTHLMVASGGPLEPGGSLFMDRDERHGKDDALLVVVSQTHPLDLAGREPLHVGLEEFLYVEAYRSFRIPLFATQRRLAKPNAIPSEAADVTKLLAAADRLGFQRIPPATRCALLERGDAAIVLYRHPHVEEFSFDIGADDPKELRRLTDILSTQVPLRPL